MRHILIPIFLLIASPSQASSLSCKSVYSSKVTLKNKELRFGQDALGRDWAERKLEKLEKSFQDWRASKGLENTEVTTRQKRKFVEEKTRGKPMWAIIDSKGTPRLIDNHHAYWTLVQFMNGRPFNVTITIRTDYTGRNPFTGRRWTRQEMVNDLVLREMILIEGIKSPRVEDLENLPNKIHKLHDSPVRSLIGFVFQAMPISIKGTDFIPGIQFRLAQKMMDIGWKGNPSRLLTPEGVEKTKEYVMSHPELMAFLRSRIRSDLPVQRKMALKKFFQNQISKNVESLGLFPVN